MEALSGLLRGGVPCPSAQELGTSILDSCLNHGCGNGAWSGDSPGSRDVDPAELAYVALTQVHRMTSSLVSGGCPSGTRSFFTDVCDILFQEQDFQSTLVALLQAEDQLLTHLAAKCLSSYMIYQLHKSGGISHVWEQTCAGVFHKSRRCGELVACMWLFTSVLKKVLKGPDEDKTDVLEKLLTPLDPPLSALCSRCLPEEGGERGERGEGGGWGMMFSGLLDLLELLSASRLRCKGVLLPIQRLTCTRAPALLKMASSSSASSSAAFFLQKRALLLLKRVLVQRAGEDMAVGAVGAVHRDLHIRADMETLADAVLQAVAADWLQCVSVGVASASFGGTGPGPGLAGFCQNWDHVMLRSISLVLLKSLEFANQPTVAAGVHWVAGVRGYLHALLGFLGERGILEVLDPSGPSHPCCWFILVFGEQDDDLMEAAKALLSLFLRHSSSSGSEVVCSVGLNPHCHFLLLLRSVSFDHSILLDFLISTETCFLEYLVCYLRLLRADAPGFWLACEKTDVSDLRHLNRGCRGIQPGGGAPGPCLVDYSSSEDSDPESMETSQSSQDVGSGVSGLSSLGGRQEEGRLTSRHPERPSGGPVPPPGGRTRARALACLSDLRTVVSRLNSKKLFPYNPSSLLKLLVQVQTELFSVS